MDAKELIGVTLGTCTLERVIGRGGMGAVYLAQQSRPVRTVAVKVLILSNVYEPDQQSNFLARFRREADTVAKLEHKNILPIYEYEEAVVEGQQLAYLVMPFIRGGTLRERIDEMKRSGSQWNKGKGCDTFGPIGPYLVTRDEIKDPQNLGMWLDVNGERRQTGNTKTMIFTVADLVADISRYMTLLPGDVITTGTPPGVGMGMKPPQYLKAGDVVSLGIEGLGEQKQKMIAYKGR